MLLHSMSRKDLTPFQICYSKLKVCHSKAAEKLESDGTARTLFKKYNDKFT